MKIPPPPTDTATIAAALTLPCRSCAQPPGQPCWTVAAHTVLKVPHIPRLDAAAGWLARQAEVDGLQRDLTAALEREARLIGENAALTKRIEELTKPEPEPEPPTTKGTIWGACILDKGSAGVVAKYGQRASVRQFQSGPTPVKGPAGSLMHLSCKTLGTDAQIDGWLKGGGIRTFKHEPDNDGMTPTQIEQWKADSNRLYDRNVSLGRPCLIAPTFTGDFWSSHTTDAERDVWLKDLKGDLFGLDFDGVHDNQTTAPTDKVYRVGKTEVTNADEIAAIQRALTKYKANGWTGFCVPEFGISRAKWDTDGAGRTRWIKVNAARFIDAGAVTVHWYDFEMNGKDDRVTVGSPEHAVLTELIARNAA